MIRPPKFNEKPWSFFHQFLDVQIARSFVYSLPFYCLRYKQAADIRNLTNTNKDLYFLYGCKKKKKKWKDKKSIPFSHFLRLGLVSLFSSSSFGVNIPAWEEQTDHVAHTFGSRQTKKKYRITNPFRRLPVVDGRHVPWLANYVIKWHARTTDLTFHSAPPLFK